tara:strand:- start:942 stop:1319 length:378 start_codon:yes stop_codon:yes gene_type:complete
MVLVFNIVGRRDYKGHGVSPQQTLTGFNTSEDATTRTILRDSWNNTAVKDKIGNYGRIITPFRGAYNLGDFLSRKNYKCGTRGGACDNTQIVGASGNVKFVPDSSLYTRFKRQTAMTKNYNDIAN